MVSRSDWYSTNDLIIRWRQKRILYLADFYRICITTRCYLVFFTTHSTRANNVEYEWFKKLFYTMALVPLSLDWYITDDHECTNVKTWVTVCSVLVFSRISEGGGGGGSGGCMVFSMSLLLIKFWCQSQCNTRSYSAKTHLAKCAGRWSSCSSQNVCLSIVCIHNRQDGIAYFSYI